MSDPNELPEVPELPESAEVAAHAESARSAGSEPPRVGLRSAIAVIAGLLVTFGVVTWSLAAAVYVVDERMAVPLAVLRGAIPVGVPCIGLGLIVARRAIERYGPSVIRTASLAALGLAVLTGIGVLPLLAVGGSGIVVESLRARRPRFPPVDFLALGVLVSIPIYVGMLVIGGPRPADIEVIVDEAGFRLDAVSRADAGTDDWVISQTDDLALRLRNRDDVDHNLVVVPEGGGSRLLTLTVEPDRAARGHLDHLDPGRYTLRCTIGGHTESATLVVADPTV